MSLDLPGCDGNCRVIGWRKCAESSEPMGLGQGLLPLDTIEAPVLDVVGRPR